MHASCSIFYVCLLHTLILLFILFIQTALIYAALNNETDITNLLLTSGADANIVTIGGMCDV